MVYKSSFVSWVKELSSLITRPIVLSTQNMIETAAQAPSPASCFYQARGNPTISFSFEETTDIQINVKGARGSGVPIQILLYYRFIAWVS